MSWSGTNIAKPDLDGLNKAVFHATDDKVVSVVEAERGRPLAHHTEVELERPELDLLIRVIEADMRWCDQGDAAISRTNYGCHFGAERNDVKNVLEKLQSCKGCPE
jgi:hypothetical protein